jgi:hypothetical protein
MCPEKDPKKDFFGEGERRMFFSGDRAAGLLDAGAAGDGRGEQPSADGVGTASSSGYSLTPITGEVLELWINIGGSILR